MLREALPKIITESVPGPKSKALIDRRHAAVPDAIGCAYPVADKQVVREPWWKIWMATTSLTGSEASVS